MKVLSRLSFLLLSASSIAANDILWMQGGNSFRVTAVVFSPSGDLVASAAYGDTSAKIWRVSDRALLRTLKARSSVEALAFSPDGNILATSDVNWPAEPDKTHVIRLWRVEDGTLLRTIFGPKGPVTSIAFSPDSTLLASTGRADRNIALWRVSDASAVRTWLADAEGVLSCVFRPGLEPVLASAGIQNQVRLWNIDGQLIRSFEGHFGPVRSIAFSAHGDLLASAGDRIDGTIRVWRYDGSLVRAIGAGFDELTSVALSPDSVTVFGGGVGSFLRGTLVGWDLSSGLPVESFVGHGGPVEAMAVSPDGMRLISGGGVFDNRLILWRRGQETQEATFTLYTGALTSLAFSADGRTVLTGAQAEGADSTIRSLNASNGTLLASAAENADVNHLAISPKGDFLASAHGFPERRVKLWQLPNLTHIRTFEMTSSFNVTVNFSSDGERLAAAGGGRIIVWNVLTGLELLIITNIGSVDSLAFSPDNSIIASAGGSSLSLRRSTDGQLIQTTQVPFGVNNIAFSPNRKVLVSAGGNNDFTITLWNAMDGTFIRRLSGHSGAVTSVSFFADGEGLISTGGYLDGTVKFWRVRDGALLRSLDKEIINANALAVSPDARFLAIGRADATTVVMRNPFGPPKINRILSAENKLSLQFEPDGTFFIQRRDNLFEGTWETIGSVVDAQSWTSAIDAHSAYFRLERSLE